MTSPRAVRYVATLAWGQAWWEVPLPPCSDCGGDLLWWEAGYAPGIRRCCGRPGPDGRYPARSPGVAGGCGRLYSVWAWRGKVFVRRLDKTCDLVFGPPSDAGGPE